MKFNPNPVIGPTDEPISVIEARMHLRNPEGSVDDAAIIGFIKTAREMVEHRLEMALLTQTWDLYLDAVDFGSCGYIDIPKKPIQSVTSISYLDSAGASVVWSPASYVVDAAAARIYLAYNTSWPTLVTDRINPATIRIVAGYASSDLIPESIKTHMKILIHEQYYHRGPLVIGQSVNELRFVDRMLDGFRSPGV